MAAHCLAALMGLFFLMLLASAIKPDPKHIAAIAKAAALNDSVLARPAAELQHMRAWLLRP